MPAPYLGGCLCGAVRYRITAEPLTLYACHCTDCQALGGGAFRLCMPVPREAVDVTQGEPELFEYTPLGARTKRATRCGACSTWLWGDPQRLPQIRIVRASTLEDRRWLDPVAHIWVRSAQPWVRIPDGALRFEGQPTDLRELMRAWETRRATADAP